MFLEIVDEGMNLVPDNTIPTFNIWDVERMMMNLLELKESTRVTRLQTTRK